MPTRLTNLEIRPSGSSPSFTHGPFPTLTSLSTITTPAPSPYPVTSSPSSSPPSSPYEIQWCISPSSSSSESSSYSVDDELLPIQTTGIRGRKSFGELAREIKKIVRPPRERARSRYRTAVMRDERKEENGELLSSLGKGAKRGRYYAGVTKKVPEKKVEKKVQKKEEKVEVDVEAGLKRKICNGQGGSTRAATCMCDGWKLVPREGVGAGSTGIFRTKMALCNQFVELLKQRYAEEDE